MYINLLQTARKIENPQRIENTTHMHVWYYFKFVTRQTAMTPQSWPKPDIWQLYLPVTIVTSHLS